MQDGGISGGAVSHFEPQVAILCDPGLHGQETYHPQYMTEQGRWQTDLNSKATCLKDKMDVLDYCKKVGVVNVLKIIYKVLQGKQQCEFLSHPRITGTPAELCILREKFMFSSDEKFRISHRLVKINHMYIHQTTKSQEGAEKQSWCSNAGPCLANCHRVSSYLKVLPLPC